MVSLQPELTFFCSQRKHQEIRAAGIYRVHDVILAHFADLTEPRIHRANAIQAVCFGIKSRSSGRGYAFRAAEQEDGKPTNAGASGSKPIEEIGTCYSLLDRQSEKLGDPDDWRA